MVDNIEKTKKDFSPANGIRRASKQQCSSPLIRHFRAENSDKLWTRLKYVHFIPFGNG